MIFLLKKRFVLLFFGVLSLFVACDKPLIEPNTIIEGREYYPLDTGFQNSYQINKTIYRLNQPTEKQSFQLKETVGNTFKQQDGQTAYRLLRYIRKDIFDNWQLDSIWSVRSEQNKIIKTEQATLYVKLEFPLKEGKTWDGNRYNGQKQLLYRIENFDKGITLFNKKYPNTLRIIQRQDTSLVNKFTSFEIYAKGIGLIYKKTESLIFCNNPKEKECFGKGIIERGEIIEQVLFERKKE